MMENTQGSDQAADVPHGILARESSSMPFLQTLSQPQLRVSTIRCIASIIRHFFCAQHRAAFLPGRIRVAQVDHPLDEKIPFTPKHIGAYLDFVPSWIRSLGFMLKTQGRKSFATACTFLDSMGALYAHAGEVYQRHLSTTKRPFYLGNPRFIPLHALDPHLMCIPSLHVMVVIRTYTFFRRELPPFAEKELYQSAIDITESVLFVKQHSVNCISAALYAMSCFEPELFPPAEAARFVGDLFADERLDACDAREIRSHILSLYQRFLREGETARGNGGHWTKPLVDFLKALPPQ